jgi:hypothetical protein
MDKGTDADHDGTVDGSGRFSWLRVPGHHDDDRMRLAFDPFALALSHRVPRGARRLDLRHDHDLLLGRELPSLLVRGDPKIAEQNVVLAEHDVESLGE